MPDATQSIRIEAAAAELAVRRFCVEAIRRAGGLGELAQALAEMGFRGRGDEYGEASLEGWIAGRRTPSSTILIALALRFRIPLDGIMAAAEAAEGAMQEAQSLTLREERTA